MRSGGPRRRGWERLDPQPRGRPDPRPTHVPALGGDARARARTHATPPAPPGPPPSEGRACRPLPTRTPPPAGPPGPVPATHLGPRATSAAAATAQSRSPGPGEGAAEAPPRPAPPRPLGPRRAPDAAGATGLLGCWRCAAGSHLGRGYAHPPGPARAGSRGPEGPSRDPPTRVHCAGCGRCPPGKGVSPATLAAQIGSPASNAFLRGPLTPTERPFPKPQPVGVAGSGEEKSDPRIQSLPWGLGS
ncbi:proline-rich protein 2-like [Eubalaena glacialis]|uniref:proline-rich protein 2-like n=1 Tax=Eubalaena glacialis TaxID=27606 RepID=UPI002A5A2225|nr:proline-rich protein 2-like [Eubalaena glacialis]